VLYASLKLLRVSFLASPARLMHFHRCGLVGGSLARGRSGRGGPALRQHVGACGSYSRLWPRVPVLVICGYVQRHSVVSGLVQIARRVSDWCALCVHIFIKNDQFLSVVFFSRGATNLVGICHLLCNMYLAINAALSWRCKRSTIPLAEGW